MIYSPFWIGFMKKDFCDLSQNFLGEGFIILKKNYFAFE